MVAASLTLSACFDGGVNGDNTGTVGEGFTAGAGSPTGQAGDCGADTRGVNWDALMTETCEHLSDYNLFLDARDPTSGPNRGGVPYELTTSLFSDYTSKYRFVFVPEGETVQYSESEVLRFPVGTVITKTFALPENTAVRDGAERVLETRLLIHRESGWTGIPYYWESESDATLAIAGKRIEGLTTINNQGQSLEFDYSVPQAADCTSCHSIVPNLTGPDDSREQIFLPIGPKVRYLNRAMAYDGGVIYNQLQYWSENQFLAGLPHDYQALEHAPAFNDLTSLDILSAQEVTDMARAYLDINCAHCHRSGMTLPENYAGPAGSSGLQLEYNRSYVDAPIKLGVCKQPIAGGKEGYPYDVIPGNAGESYLAFRIETTDSRHRMPELGRNTVHQEGVQLIRRWIGLLPDAPCSASD